MAPETSMAELRQEWVDADRSDRLLWGAATWFFLMATFLGAALLFTVFSNISSACDALARVCLVAMALALLPMIGYSIGFAIDRRKGEPSHR
jgi:cobalamin biosynthesis protein CobD/CbiB